MATYQQWSQSYFTNLTPTEHNINNNWFQLMRDRLTDSGILYVPIPVSYTHLTLPTKA